MLIAPRALSFVGRDTQFGVPCPLEMRYPHPGSSESASPWTCTDVLVHLYEFIDGALPAESDERMRSHIGACAHCRPAFEKEREFLELIWTHVKVERCPEEVRRRILLALERRETSA